MCWYDPPELSKKKIKTLCQQLVDEVRILEKDGDPIGISIREVKELIDHLADESLCKEKIN
jgi:hypothetical protein